MPKSKLTENKKGAKKVRSYAVKEYLSDLHKNGMLYAAIVRSPSRTGRITNIDTSVLPDEFTLYTAREVPGTNIVKIFSTETELFCTGEVHWEGEPIGLLVGPDVKSVRTYAKKIPIIFDYTPFEKASKELSKNYNRPVIKLNEEIENENIQAPHSEKVLSKRILKTGFFKNEYTESEEEDFFASFKYDIENTWNYDEISSDWTETSGAFCATESGNLNVYLPTQWPGQLEKSLSQVLKLSEDKIEIRRTLSQNKNINGAWRSIILACETAVASHLSGKSVKLLLSREEQKLYMKNGLETTIKLRTAVDEEGIIQVLKAEITADAGYQNPFSQEIADILTIALVNLYSPEHIFIETKILSSPNPPTSISHEKLDAASFFASECQIHEISRLTGILPDELKFKNIQRPEANFKFKGIKYFDAVNAIVSQSDFKRKYAASNLKRNILSEENHIFFSLPKKGIALSTGLDGAFFLGSSFESYQQKIALTLEKDGTLKIDSPIPSTSISDIWKKIASQMLSIEPSLIQINNDTENVADSALPDGFSSNISIMTNLLKKCCLEIQKKHFQVPLPISAKKTTTAAIKKAFNQKNFSGTPFYSTAFGTAIIELECNPYTYSINIKGIWIAIDCGEILSIKDAENTVRLAIQQELENLVDGEKLSSASTRISFVQSTNPPCQLGQLIHNLIPGAFASALSQALGFTVSKIPCTQEEIYSYILSAEEEAKLKKDKLEDKGDEIEEEIEDVIHEETEEETTENEEEKLADEELAEEELVEENEAHISKESSDTLENENTVKKDGVKNEKTTEENK